MIKRISTIILTLITLASYTVAWASCNTFSASFNGTTQYLTAVDSTSLSITTDNLTMDAWVRFSSDPEAGDEKHIMGKADATFANSSFLLRYIPGAGLYSTSYSGAAVGRQCATTNFSPVVDTWYHIASVIDASVPSITTYVDGTSKTLSCSGTGIGINDGTANFNIGIGRSDVPDRWFPGLIDEVRISNNLRYSGNFTPQTDDFTDDANTMGLWHFNSDLTTDDSGNGNTLTNVNSVTQSATVPYVGTTCSAGGAVKFEEMLIIFE